MSCNLDEVLDPILHIFDNEYFDSLSACLKRVVNIGEVNLALTGLTLMKYIVNCATPYHTAGDIAVYNNNIALFRATIEAPWKPV